RGPPFRALVAAGHVLPDEQPKLVAPVVPTLGFYLYVFAGHVEPKLLHHFDVIAKRFIGGCSVEPIRPEALVERAEHKARLVVQMNPQTAPIVARHADLAHAEVTFDLINNLAVIEQ